MKKETATDYFYDRVISIFCKYHEEDVPTFDFSQAITEAFEQAKALEREYMMQMYTAGKLEGIKEGPQTANEYFNETYGN
jgi:hypothetical protein